MIKAASLTKHYGNKIAVDSLDFTVEPGRVTGFLGPNGAGKSTTMRMILGLDRPTSESVTVNGRPYTEHRAPLCEVGALLDARAMLQDTDFAIRQLVDIGLRALSPAVHDPTTAIEVILRLGSLLRTVLTTPLAPDALQDHNDCVVVQPWNLSHEEYIIHAFDQLRMACCDQTEVISTILRVLRMLEGHVDPELIPVLARQRRLLLESLNPDMHPEDRARLRALATHEVDPADHSR